MQVLTDIVADGDPRKKSAALFIKHRNSVIKKSSKITNEWVNE